MKHGDETIQIFEIDQPLCKKAWGTTNAFGTCSAALSASSPRKCFNTRFTCPVPNDYLPGVLTLRFARPQDGVAHQYGPLIHSLVGPIQTAPGSINLAGTDTNMKAFGQRERVTVRLGDHRHSDLLVDPYRLERLNGLAIFGPSVYSTAALALTPFGYWRHDELTGTVATDSSGNGRNGSYTATMGLGDVGALEGDSSASILLKGSEAVTFGSGAAFKLNTMTVTGWVRPTELASQQGIQRFLWNFFGSNTDFGLWRLADGRIKFVAEAGGAEGFLESTVVINNFAYVFVALVYDGTKMKIYLNGKLHVSVNHSVGGNLSWSGAGTATWLFGSGGGSSNFIGNLDESAVFNGALTDQQIAGLYVAGKDGKGYDPYPRGTFWGKWIARNPYYPSFRCRVREGTVGQALSEMSSRSYVIDTITGPGEDGVTITAKDLFSLVEARKSVAPKASNGRIQTGITAAVGQVITLLPAGIGDLEYPGSGDVRIGDEVATFTRVGDAMTLTVRGVYNTAPAAHDAEDRVQLVLSFVNTKAVDIVYALLTTYGNLSGVTDIDKIAWDAAASSLTSVYTGRITEPTPVETLVGELMVQAGFTVWPEVTTGKIEFAALVPTEASPIVDDDAWSADTDFSPPKRLDQKRVSQVWVYYAQVDPTKKVDDPNNFRSRFIGADLSSEGPTKYGTPAIFPIFSRWIPQFGRTVAQKVSDRLSAMFLDPPVEMRFKLFNAKRALFSLAKLFKLKCAEIQDDTGAQATVTHAVLEIASGESEFKVRSQSIKFAFQPPPGTEQLIQIENSSLNLNLRTIWDSLFSAPSSTTVVRFLIMPGVTIGSASTALFALRTGSWPVGATVIVENRGRVQAKGGQGGFGGGFNQAGGNGENGGDAFLAEFAVQFDNLVGQLFAGGGGGGGGGGGSVGNGTGGGGGGAGAGTNPGVGGAKGIGGNGNSVAENGHDGTADAGGAKGLGGAPGFGNGSDGGDGGGIALNGAPGSGEYFAGGSPGVKGRYVVGNASVTWLNNGDRRGDVA